MSSETGRLSTTSQASPEADPSPRRPISSCRRAISAGSQTAPVGTWWSAETTPSTPACSMSSIEHRSFGPNHRHVCRISPPKNPAPGAPR